MTDDFAQMGYSQSRALFDVEERYYCEAQKCQQAEAYLAGCVMLGAALEANLVAMVTFYPNEAADWYKQQHPKKKSVKPLLDWNLGELLEVANALGWLPAGGADVIRRQRNWAHPGRYVKDFPSSQITADSLIASFEALHDVYRDLRAALSAKAKLQEAAQHSGSRAAGEAPGA